MNRIFLTFCLLALAGCERAPLERSPFQTRGHSPLDGIIGCVRADRTGFGYSGAIDDRLQMLPAGFVVDVLWLDPKPFGGGFALVASGAKPDLLIGVMAEVGLIAPAESGRFKMLPELSKGAGRLASRVMQFGGGEAPFDFSFELQRFDAADRVVLVPTVDLQLLALQLSQRLDEELGRRCAFAISLDAARLRRWASKTLLTRIEQMSAMMGALSAGRSEKAASPGELMSGVVRSAINLLDQLDGLEVRKATLDGDFEARLYLRTDRGAVGPEPSPVERPATVPWTTATGAGANGALAFAPGRRRTQVLKSLGRSFDRVHGDGAPSSRDLDRLDSIWSGELAFQGSIEHFGIALRLLPDAGDKLARDVGRSLAQLVGGGEFSLRDGWIVAGAPAPTGAGDPDEMERWPLPDDEVLRMRLDALGPAFAIRAELEDDVVVLTPAH